MLPFCNGCIYIYIYKNIQKTEESMWNQVVLGPLCQIFFMFFSRKTWSLQVLRGSKKDEHFPGWLWEKLLNSNCHCHLFSPFGRGDLSRLEACNFGKFGLSSCNFTLTDFTRMNSQNLWRPLNKSQAYWDVWLEFRVKDKEYEVLQ